MNSFGTGMDPTSVDPPLAAGLGNFDDYDLHSDLLNDFLDGEVISKKNIIGSLSKTLGSRAVPLELGRFI